jgi:hypothetical protein
VPEPTAEPGGHDPDPVLRQVEDPCQIGTHQVRVLRRGVHRELSARRPVREVTPPFQRRGLVTLDPELLGQDMRRPGQGRLRIPHRVRHPHQDVVGPVLEHPRRRLRQGLLELDHSGQHLVVHPDRFQRGLGAGDRIRDDHGNRVPDETHLVVREHLQHRRPSPGTGRVEAVRQRPRQVQRLGTGDHRPHTATAASRLGVDSADPGVRIGTAKDRHVQGAGGLEIVEIFGTAGEHQVAIPAPDLFDGRPGALACHHFRSSHPVEMPTRTNLPELHLIFLSVLYRLIVRGAAMAASLSGLRMA